MEPVPCRHEISDETWRFLEPHLPGRKGAWGGNAHDNRRFVNAVFWVLRSGAQWRDLPPDYGDWKNTHRRFCRWRDRGVWEHLLELLAQEPGYEWLMVDAGQPETPPQAPAATSGRRGPGRPKRDPADRYRWPWMRLVCRSEYLLRKLPQLLAVNKLGL